MPHERHRRIVDEDQQRIGKPAIVRVASLVVAAIPVAVVVILAAVVTLVAVVVMVPSRMKISLAQFIESYGVRVEPVVAVVMQQHPACKQRPRRQQPDNQRSRHRNPTT